MKNNLRNLCEQIQEGILTYADSGLVSLTQENLDELCEIVVSNFREFDSTSDYYQTNREQSFIIEEIEFDVSGFEDGYWAPGEWSEEELQQGLQKEWRGRIVGPVSEEELVDHITDLSGWCIRHLEYGAIVPANNLVK
jgi:tRNA U34 5-carboxymethylaminomethyl modifying GTPase MnmE/TrmE